MPITLAHPVAVVPLAGRLGRWAALSALVWGSLMPDILNYGTRSFLGATAARTMSHSLWPGAILFAVVFGWPLWLFYQVVLKRPLAALLPDKVFIYTLRQPLLGPLYTEGPWWRWLTRAVVITASLVVGAGSHVMWDWFTHGRTPVGNFVPLLNRKLLTISHYDLHVYTLTQHGSSLVGLTILACWSWRWLKSQPEPAAGFRAPLQVSQRVGIMATLILASCLVGTVGGFQRAHGALTLGWLEDFAGPAVVITLRTCGALLGIYGIVWCLAVQQLRRNPL